MIEAPLVLHEALRVAGIVEMALRAQNLLGRRAGRRLDAAPVEMAPHLELRAVAPVQVAVGELERPLDAFLGLEPAPDRHRSTRRAR